MIRLAENPKFTAFDANGGPLVGGKLYTYATGTTIPKSSWVDANKVAANANPVILDSKGQCSLFLDVSAGLYRLKLTDADDNVMWTMDNVGTSEGNLADSLGTAAYVDTGNADDEVPLNGAEVNYSDSTVVTGWSSTTTKKVYVRKIGKLVFVAFSIVGTSNATTARFTVPYTLDSKLENGGQQSVCYASDNGGAAVVGGLRMIGFSGRLTVACYPDTSFGNWTASGTKIVSGSFFYISD